MLNVKNLVCGYLPGKPVTGPLSFQVKQGEIACLVGPNGIGKTTLFKTILGLLRPLGGTIKVKGEDYRRYTPKEFARLVAYVPQGHIPPFPYTVRDVVVMGRNPNMHELSSPDREDYRAVEEVLSLMGIEHLAGRDYTEISGGERQMVLIARALAQNTNLLVMDEPTTHLDYGNETRVLGQVKKLAALGYTIVMITHVPNHAFICADKVLALGRNGYFSVGPPDETLTEESLLALYGVDIQLSKVILKQCRRPVKVCVPMTI
ncbi:MAG: ABC transporter ATP-binding protein [Firmicutes bacterium]|nr:ABC transporter ATP-binding protein [Bacillota bacterium]